MTADEILEAHYDGEPVLWTKEQAVKVIAGHDVLDDDLENLWFELHPKFNAEGKIDAWEVLGGLGY